MVGIIVWIVVYCVWVMMALGFMEGLWDKPVVGVTTRGVVMKGTKKGTSLSWTGKTFDEDSVSVGVLCLRGNISS